LWTLNPETPTLGLSRRKERVREFQSAFEVVEFWEMVDAPSMTLSLRPTRRQVFFGYLTLPHVVPIAVVIFATAAFAEVATDGRVGLGQLAWLLGAMFGAQLAIGAVNELVDADLDAVAKPDKPIPAGLVSRGGARIVAISGVVLMAACSLCFSFEAFVLCAFGTGVGMAYSVWFKRTIWSWIPYLIALPLLPIWVWTALNTVEPGLFGIYPIGATAIIAVQIAQSLPDIAADRNSGVKTLAVVLGPSRARQVCWAAMIGSALLAAGLAPWLTDHPLRVWLAAFVACGLVGLNVAIWKRNPRSGALACFPCVAVGAVALGIGWTAALVNL
jgi:4-hydroxybenzoate polyprenyltransferase